MPPFLRFILTAEKRESKDASFQKILKLLQTQQVYDVQDSKFFEKEAQSLLEFTYSYKSSNRAYSSDDQDGAQPLEKAPEDTERTKIIKICQIAANNQYRNVVDILTKMNLKNINISNAKEALNMLRSYKSDHILLLPKIEQLLKKDQ